MRTLLLSIIAIALSFSRIEAQALRIDLRGVASDSSVFNRPAVEVFRGQILIPVGETREVFTGPYSVQLRATEASRDTYAIATSFFGLGPKYHSLDYNIKLAAGDDIFVPPLPVKNDASVKYFIKIVDDTSMIASSEPPLGDSTAWGVSETVHYKTHWIRGSLADFMWNLKMAYLERIYDGFRKTFTVSSFYKIDYVFHPEPVPGVYIKPGQNYAIQPRKMWIDIVYGHAADGVTPRAAAELLLYKQWGYGPRWMVSGFAGYYFDNFLQLRKFADKLTAGQLDSLLGDEAWVDSDTGRVVTGAFARWLVDSDLLSKFMKLYKDSGPLDFDMKFAEIYGRDFETALGDFLEAARAHKPGPGELQYFASIYMDLGRYEAARGYLEEIVAGGGEEAGKFRTVLTKCLFWLGDYNAAGENSHTVNTVGTDACNLLRANIETAGGSSIFSAYGPCLQNGDPDALISVASAYLDVGNIAAADSMLSLINDRDKNGSEYLIESARIKMLKGQRADSLLAMAAAIALNRAQAVPHDPVNYLVAGQAFSLMGNFGRAKENLETSHFLERRPYFLGQVLLELGRLYDLKAERNRALEYYNEVVTINAGAYQKSPAKGYLEKKYEIKGVANSQ